MAIFKKIIIFATLIFIGCSTSINRAIVKDVDVEQWYSPVELSFEVSDTTEVNDLAIFMRYQRDIELDSINVVIATTTPDLVEWRENVSFPIAGSSKDDIVLSEFDYRKRVALQQKGVYTIKIYPQHIYAGIEAIGINIKPHQL